MLEESKNLIISNFPTLIKECDVEILKKLVVEKAVFTEKELNDIFAVITYEIINYLIIPVKYFLD